MELIQVQELPATDGMHPFDRLITLLQRQDFTGAAIDAPFSLPKQFMERFGSHQGLLTKMRNIEYPSTRPFPDGVSFVKAVIGQNPPLEPPKPLRETERNCAPGINVRSTLWTGARPGAPMTAACLTLLAKTGVPIWPWSSHTKTGLLVEAFPAAQLVRWEMSANGYNGNTSEAREARDVIIKHLATRIFLPSALHELMRCSADALDAVLCGFAAIAVTKGIVAIPPTSVSIDEGWIAVHP